MSAPTIRRGHSLAVVPLPDGVDALADLGEDIVYEIVPSTLLPIIDISRSVRTELFPKTIVNRFDRIVSRTRVLVFVMAHFAMGLCAASLLAPAQQGRWLAIPTFLLSIPLPMIQVMLMRYEIVLLLFTTYDFWFFTSSWLLCIVLFSLCLNDMRALINVTVWFSLQVNIAVDATTSFRDSVWLTVVGLFYSVGMIGAIGIGAIDELRDVTLFTANGYVVTAQIIVLNAWSTCLLVLVRNVYRRRAAIRDHGANKTVVQCLSYRCRVRLRARGRNRRSVNSLSSLTSASSASSVQMTRPTASYFENIKMIQMRCMRVKVKFSPRNLVARFTRRLLDENDSACSFIILRAVNILLMEAGAILTSASFIPGVPSGCHYASLITTGLFAAISLSMYHRQLLKFLIFSFDFAFLTFQVSVMHLALADLYGWDSRAFAIGSVWVWFHWVLTFDCMPPILRWKLRLRYRFVVLIAVQFVLAHILLIYQLVAFDRGVFKDRAIVTITFNGNNLEIRVLPLLVSRLATTFGWSCRIVLRLLRRNENELIIIQGTVTYVNNRRKIKIEHAKYTAATDRTKSKMLLLTRQITRRMSAIAGTIAPNISSLSATEHTTIEQSKVTRFSPLPRDARLMNIAGNVYDASRVISVLRQMRKVESPTELPEDSDLSMKNPRLDSRIVSSLKPLPLERSFKAPSLDDSLTIMPLDSSMRSDFAATGARLEEEPKETSECIDEQPRFVI